MREQHPTVLVLGATGKTGSRVTADLVRRGVEAEAARKNTAAWCEGAK